MDRDRLRLRGPNAVQTDAAHLPFGLRRFPAVISNHSLEHFDDLDGALAEIGRVVRPDGALYVGVPDAGTFSDRLYRWLSRGGGHVNPFVSADRLGAKISAATGLPLAATRTLHTGFAFLNRHNRRSPAPRKLLLLGGGAELPLQALSYAVRLADRFWGTRWSVYGWALYFGSLAGPVERQAWTNVCVRCGSGYSSAWLRYEKRIVRRLCGLPFYGCPQCGAFNGFTED